MNTKPRIPVGRKVSAFVVTATLCGIAGALIVASTDLQLPDLAAVEAPAAADIRAEQPEGREQPAVQTAAPDPGSPGQQATAASTTVPEAAAAAEDRSPAWGTAIVNVSRVNLRRGPGTNFGWVGNAVAGDELPVYARNPEATWLQLDETGETWILAELVDIPGDPDEIPISAFVP